MLRSLRFLSLLCALLAASVLAGLVPQGTDEAGRTEGGCPIPGEPGTTTAEAVPFEAWLENYKEQALRCGISAQTIQAAFDGLSPSGKVRRLDRRQPEYNKTFFGYLGTRVTDGLVRIGRDRLRQHLTLLTELESRYGVEKEVLVALWGLESGFGADMGSLPAFTALSTLAHDGRRSAFYRDELLSALRIVEDGHREPERMPSSWAGAVGQTQFMPSTFLAHAVDADGDGRIDVWDSIPDALASGANYLSRLGWNTGQPWGREVLLPDGFDAYQARLDLRASAGFWSEQGVLGVDGRPLPDSDPVGAVVLPAGIRGPAFLVYDNFRVLTEWNRSLFYALSVGHLWDRLAGKRALAGKPPPGDAPLQLRTVASMQADLNALGYAAGEADGMVGRQTRQALRDYQRERNMVADAYPTPDLIARLRAELLGEAFPPVAPEPQPGDILAMQRGLVQLGYEVGGLDGKMGPMTRRAMQAYLRDRGHPPADEPTPEIIRLLVREGQTAP
jgi:membrane-bound lytic murein transglycosylase B